MRPPAGSPGEQLALQRGIEALRHGVVATIPHGAHGLRDTRLAAAAAKGETGVLAAVIRMVDEPSGWSAVLHRHRERVLDQRGAEMIRHGPAHAPAAPGAEDDRQVEK